MQGKAFTKEQREAIVKSLQPYLEMGFSRNKACEFIGLKPQTLSVWVQEDESLLMTLTGWENVINTIAINNIAQAVRKEAQLDDDLRKENSWKWAERRMKDDFSTKTEQSIVATVESINEDSKERIENAIDEILTKDEQIKSD